MIKHLKMGRRVAGLLIAMTALSINAQTTNNQTTLSATPCVESIKEKLPIETVATGTIISIVSPETPLTVTTDMGNVSEQNMRAFAQAPDMFKNAIMSNFSAMGDTLVPLAEIAYNAGIPFSIHITSSTFPEGFTITFSLEDLKKGLGH